MADTLVLSHSFEPLRTIRWQRAVQFISLGKVEVLERYEGWEVGSISVRIPVPAVVRLLRKLHPRRTMPRLSRENLLARDRSTCQYCGRRMPSTELTFEHVLPRSRGGKTTWDNIVMACIACNIRKANRTPAEAGMRLRSMPRRPDFLPLLSLRLGRQQGAPSCWANYLRSHQYWTTELEE